MKGVGGCSSSSSSSSSLSVTEKVLTGLSNLIKLLPTGTVFVFQFLSPVLSNNGHCYTINKVLTAILLVLCGGSCAFSSFTDSYTDSKGKTHYVIATKSGVWPSPSSSDAAKVNVSSYKLKFADFVHASFAVIVFATLAVLDANTVGCFFPALQNSESTMLSVLPPVIGTVSGVLFAVFPSTRHGIGYASSSSSSTSDSNIAEKDPRKQTLLLPH
ncbi:hypothetical protein Dimus_029279 [Dionaea muscipula]